MTETAVEYVFEQDPTEIVKNALLHVFGEAPRWSVVHVAPYSRSPREQGFVMDLAVRWHETGNPQGRTALIRIEAFDQTR